MLKKRITAPLILIIYAAVISLFSISAYAVSEWTATSVSTNGFDQVNPAISGSIIVWQDYRNKTYACAGGENCQPADIYVADINTPGSERKLNVPLVDGDLGALDPDISGNKVVWRGWATGHIRVHDLSNDSEQNASTGGGQKTWPAISGNKVVWSDYRNSISYADIYMRDLTAASDAPVSVGPTTIESYKRDKTYPDIDGDIVVWEDMRNAYKDTLGWVHNKDIYMKNLSTGVEQAVCTNIYEQYHPVVSGNKVLWYDARNANKEIYMKDLTTGVETRLTNNIQDQSWPDISGDFIVWKDSRSGAEDIYLRRLSTGAEVALTLDSNSQKLPAISGTTVVWMDKRSGNWDIYTAEDTVAPTISSVSPGGWLASTAATISASFSESGTGIDTTTATAKLDGVPVGGCTVSTAGISCPVSGLTQGPHSISVGVSDIAGNAATGGSSFNVDSAAPQITDPAPLGSQSGGSVTIGASYGDPAPGSGVNAATLSVLLDGNPVGGCAAGAGSFSCDVSGLAEGNHSVAVGISDNAGNSGSQEWSFSIDSNGPVINGLQPAPGSVLNNAAPAIGGAYSDSGEGIDAASIRLYVDDEDVTSQAAVDGATAAYTPAAKLDDGMHTARLVAADTVGNASEQVWTFTVTSPALTLSTTDIYWPSYASYLERQLAVDYRMANPGSGLCREGQVAANMASNGVLPLTSFPINLNDMAPGTAAGYSIIYLVPPSVYNFVSYTYASCIDDGSNVYWFAGPPPG